MKIYLSAAWIAFVLSFLFLTIGIPLLRRLHAGQNILSYVKEHKQKSGTPTMGGIAFIAAAVLSVTLFAERAERSLVISAAIGLSYMTIGLLDDCMKILHKENLGLRAWQKLLFQTAVAILAGVYCMRAELTSVYLPFSRRSLQIGGWIFPLSVLVFLSTVNAVNLTDGLDGLAAGTSVPFFLALAAIIVAQNGKTGLSLLCFCLTGALLAYLFFNVSPAAVFMGDTGSLSLGGFAASVALFSGNALYIPVLGVCFVLSVISVIVQVIYYKATGGKRVFLMSPVHHHFQKKGYSETRISYAYFALTAFTGAACLLAIL